ncbi:IS110 family transposase [Vibrio sp. SA48]
MANVNNYSAYVGLDVHKDTIAVAIASPERQGEVRFWGNISSSKDSVIRLMKKLMKLYPSFLVCYEAGPTGYGIYRLLLSSNIDCTVVAPSRIPKISTNKIKNDHRDAVALARLLRAGELVEVWVPDITHEAMRDLIRARSCSKKDEKVAKQRIQSILLRAGKRYDKKMWTVRHRIWLANQSFPLPSQQIAYEHYRQSLEQIENRITQLDQEIDRLLPDWSLYNLVNQLQALKGVGRTIAISVVAELGDFSRFSNPKQIMAFLGLIPSEYSSGTTVRKAGITKAGNVELRRLLYEAAWSYRTKAKVGNWLVTYRPDSVCQEAKDISWKAQQRLCFRYRSLLARGKRSQVAITAVARELLGFMWDIAVTIQPQKV